MKVYLLILQPDGDWDHLPDLLGVFTTPEAAWSRVQDKVTSSRYNDYQVHEFELDQYVGFDRKAKKMPRPVSA